MKPPRWKSFASLLDAVVPIVFVLIAYFGNGADAGGNVSVQIADVPHVKQKPDFCGEACVEMDLRKLGFKIDQDAVFDASGLDPSLGRGCHAADLYRAIKTRDCPAWFNEGLGSLYEQAVDRDGEIVGNVNWRLPALQKLIKAGGFQKEKLPTFKKLTALTDDEFYGAATGNNYAQSRYLCYYLQQKHLLRKFYAEFLKNRKTDPTGYETLKRILKTKNMEKFQKNWENYVLSLKYP